MNRRHLFALITCLLLAAPSLSSAAEDIQTERLASCLPEWKPGDEWYVESIKASEEPEVPPEVRHEYPPPRDVPFVFRFLVAQVTEIDGQACYEVIVSCFSRDGELMKNDSPVIVYFAEKELSVLRTVRFYERSRRRVDRFDKPPYLPTALEGLLTLYWPSFSQDQLEAHQSHQSVQPAGGNDERLVVEIVGPGEKRISQTWEKGKPWWSQAEYYHYGRLKCKCRLITPEEAVAQLKNGEKEQERAAQ